MPTRVKASLDTVLKAARDKVVVEGLVTASCASVSLNPDTLADAAPPSDRFVGVTFESFRQPAEAVTTDAETDEVVVVEGELVLALYFNIRRDSVGRDDVVFTTADAEVVPFIQAVTAAYHNRELTNADGDYVLMNTLTLLAVRMRGPVGKAQRVDRVDVVMECMFQWDLAAKG